MRVPKYSIIIPTYNGIKYLPTCVETIISQDYNDYELIISDDHSVDGTQEYLKTLKHQNIKIIFPANSLSMTEHWEWALSHTKGEWLIFVGQDDGLQSYFFELADKLTEEAKKKKLRTIMSSRAYFFWEGCKSLYGDIAVGYNAIKKTKVHNFKYESFKALLGFQDYFELPQMYTTALFNKDLLDEARAKQNGKVLTCHPQDANLAAIACSLEEKYLKSYIPLGWVGTSPKSAGMSMSSSINKNKEIEVLKKEYLQKISKSKLKYHEWAGDFAFGTVELYYWQALLMTQNLRSMKINKIIKSKFFKTILFSRVLYKKKNYRRDEFNLNEFKKILKTNKCNKHAVNFIYSLIKIFANLFNFMCKIKKKIINIVFRYRINLNIRRDNDIDKISMIKISKNIEYELKKNYFLEL